MLTLPGGVVELLLGSVVVMMARYRPLVVAVHPRPLIRVGSFSSCASPVHQQTDRVQERHCIIFGRKEARACCQHTPRERERRDSHPGVRQLIILRTYLFECNKQSDMQEWSGWTGTACLVSLILMAFSFHYSRSACLVHLCHSTTTGIRI